MINKSNQKLNKIWVDTEVYSTHNKGKSVVAWKAY